MKRTIEIAKKEAKEILRNRLFLILAFLVPFVMFVVFGYGISLDIENIPFGVVDYDQSALSRRMIDGFLARHFQLKYVLSDTKEAEKLLSTGKVRAVLVVPPDFTKGFYKKHYAELQMLIDGGYPYTALTVRGYAESIVEDMSYRKLNEMFSSENIQIPRATVNLRYRYFFNESLKSSFALVPALIAIVLLVNPAVLAAISIAREKEFGTIYNIYSTPVGRLEFLAGKLIPYVLISVVNFFVVLLTIKILFHIPMKGNLLNLLPAAVFYVMATVSIGLFISTLTRTVVSAQIITLIVTVIPAFLYSGLLIPVANLGTEGKVMAHLYPTMYFLKIIHGVYLKRLTVSEMAFELVMLIFYFLFIFAVSVMLFRKREG